MAAFYGVYVPSTHDDKQPLVFTNRDEAFKVLKTHNDARLKVFKLEEDAEYFSQFGQDHLIANSSIINDSTSKLKSPSAINAEKAAFRAPRIQELVEFRKAIESGNMTLVHSKITENPRFLVGSGDTPSILKESVRYNALHVAALSKSGKMCDLLLSTIGKPTYVQMLHGRNNKKVAEEVSEILVDLFLNMPEKGRNETPLHLAVKNGYVEVVEVLTSYPQCKMLPNNEDKLPKDLICFRAPGASEEVRERIKNLLEERFFVPVIRSVDNSLPPTIGEPFSSKKMPSLNANPMSPELEIKAIAGPMNMEQAESFRRRWKTPPSFSKSQNSSMNLSTSFNSSNNQDLLLIRSPIRKRAPPGLLASPTQESLASTPISKAKSPMFSICEFIKEEEKTETPNEFKSPFSGNSVKKKLFSNFRSRLETSLSSSSLKEEDEVDEVDDGLNSSYKVRHLKLADSEKGLEVVGRMLAKEQNIGWKEYWNFLDNFVNLSTSAGLQQLEQHLKSRAEIMAKRASDSAQVNKLNISDICQKLNEFHLKNNSNKKTAEKAVTSENALLINGDTNNNHTNTSPVPLNAHLCVEKSCQVYAKRVTKIIVNNFDNTVSLNTALNSELQRLEALVCSYKDDVRFKKINFQCVHSRFARLILTYLLDDEATYKNLLPKLKKSLSVIMSSKIRFSSDDDYFYKGGERLDTTDKDSITIKTTSHLKCLSKYFLNFVENEEERLRQFCLDNLTAENECEEVWLDEAKCSCVWNARVQSSLHNTHLKYPHLMKMRNKNKKKSINQMIRKKIDLSHATDYSTWEYRERSSQDDEDEVFWSDASDHSGAGSVDSDDCVFYTPVESPTEFLTASDNSDVEDDQLVNRRAKVKRPKSIDLSLYKNYILGDEPTKTDIDVFNAICDTEISSSLYPNLVKWQKAIRNHSAEEIQNFPSLSFIVKRSIPIWKAPDTNTPVTSRRLFASPVKNPIR